jgi:hypothetical protein
VSNFVQDAVQLSLEDSLERKAESISGAFDRLRGKYGARSLQTGRTAFDKAVEDERWAFGKRTGLSAQMK